MATGDPLRIVLELRGEPPVDDPIVGVALHRVDDGVVCWDVNTETDGVRLGRVERPQSRSRSTSVDLVPGEYAIDPGVYRGDWSYALDYHWQAYPLRVTGRGGGHGVARPPLHWAVRDVSAEVTVVIPTRDRPALLADALASVAAQDHPPAPHHRRR